MNTIDPVPCSRAYYLAIADRAIAVSRGASSESARHAFAKTAALAMVYAMRAARVAS